MQPEFLGMSAFGLIFVAIALWIYKITQKKRSVFTVPAEAELIDYEKGKRTVSDEDGYGAATCYYPILRYSVEGMEREVKHVRGADRRKWKSGARISIRYNPLEPDSVMIPGDNFGEFLFVVVFGLPGMLCAIAGILYAMGV